MNSVLNEFKADLNHLREYINSNEKISKLLSYTPTVNDNTVLTDLLNNAKQHLTTFRLRKVYEYNALVVGLYGSLEKFIEAVIRAYLVELNSLVPSYNQLPEVIKNNHYQLSANLLNNLIYRKYENITTKEEIVDNLHSCNANTGYKLNIHAYINHSANLKHDVIAEMLAKIGFPDITGRIKRNRAFSDFLQTRLSLDVSIRNEILFSRLQKIIELRNDISHGISASEILHPTVLSEYIDFVDFYGSAIYESLNEECLRWQAQFQAIEFTSIIQVINNRILCVNVGHTTLSVGDFIIVRGGEENSYYYYQRLIVSIQVNNVDYPNISIGNGIDVGLGLNGHIKENHKFFLVRRQIDTQLSLSFPVYQ